MPDFVDVLKRKPKSMRMVRQILSDLFDLKISDTWSKSLTNIQQQPLHILRSKSGTIEFSAIISRHLSSTWSAISSALVKVREWCLIWFQRQRWQICRRLLYITRHIEWERERRERESGERPHENLALYVKIRIFGIIFHIIKNILKCITLISLCCKSGSLDGNLSREGYLWYSLSTVSHITMSHDRFSGPVVEFSLCRR